MNAADSRNHKKSRVCLLSDRNCWLRDRRRAVAPQAAAPRGWTNALCSFSWHFQPLTSLRLVRQEAQSMNRGCHRQPPRVDLELIHAVASCGPQGRISGWRQGAVPSAID